MGGPWHLRCATARLQYELDLALGLLIGALFLGGLAPTRFIYSSVKDKPRSLFDDVPALLGRLSCIGLGSTILAEAVTGKVRQGLSIECSKGLSIRRRDCEFATSL